MLSLRRTAFALRVRPIQSRATTPSRIVTPTLTCRSRSFHLEGLALAPVVFGGLFIALWTWKCCMLVIFQNKIIYMPGLPPNARWEKIEDYAKLCGGVRWREERTRSADGTDLALCVADVDVGRPSGAGAGASESPDSNCYILYFQGNASSIPPRLPDLSSALCMLKRRIHEGSRSIKVTFVCLSYRGYWTSRGRPTEKGIRLDAAAGLNWIAQQHGEPTIPEARASASSTTRKAEVFLWGQSIGAGVATNLAAEYQMPGNLHLNSLILETPFTSIRAMLEVLYPQKWLPYKHLWPFLQNHLDSWQNLGIIAEKCRSEGSSPNVFILAAAKDELVPAELSQMLYDRSIEVGLSVERKDVGGAFHNDTMFRAEGRKAVSAFIAQHIEG
ncbi:Alpha/Beta hydrolase protein [Xylariales sp. AK1849]|nr:Alpha/Beta hydrolase protein [Xylariales sp. AK1849]